MVSKWVYKTQFYYVELLSEMIGTNHRSLLDFDNHQTNPSGGFPSPAAPDLSQPFEGSAALLWLAAAIWKAPAGNIPVSSQAIYSIRMYPGTLLEEHDTEILDTYWSKSIGAPMTANNYSICLCCRLQQKT